MPRDRAAAGLIGPNGPGKATLFNVITGYQRADEGQVYFRDKASIPGSVNSTSAARSVTRPDRALIGRLYQIRPL